MAGWLAIWPYKVSLCRYSDTKLPILIVYFIEINFIYLYSFLFQPIGKPYFDQVKRQLPVDGGPYAGSGKEWYL